MQCLFFIRSKIIYCENSLLQAQTLLWKLNSMSHNFLHLAFGFVDEFLSSSNHSNSTTLFQRSSYDGLFYIMHDPLLLISCDTKLLFKKIHTWNCIHIECGWSFSIIMTTVKPLLTGLLLNGHLLLNRHLSNSQNAVPWLTVNLTSIKWSPLLSGCSHHLELETFLVFHLH